MKTKIFTLLLTLILWPYGMRAQDSDGGYTINFEEETITIDEGYNVYTAETDGTEIQSGGSITDYIGQKLYIENSESSGRTAISIPARRVAPTYQQIPNLDYEIEKLTVGADRTPLSSLEYSDNYNRDEWNGIPESAQLSDMGWDGRELSLYFRFKATEDSFAGLSSIQSVEIKARPNKPSNASRVTSQTETSITISTVSGQEYRCGTNDNWSDWRDGTNSAMTFENLTPGTEYTIQNRYKSGRDDTTGREQFASFANSTTATTPSVEEPEKPEEPDPEEPEPIPDPEEPEPTPDPEEPEPTPDPETPETPVIPDMPKYYNIMVEECEGATVETSTNVVREGTSVTFTIEVAEGYTAEDMVVKVKRSLFGTTDGIEPNDEGVYEVKNIYTDIYITVDGITEETPTGIEDIEGAKVYTKEGSIYVYTPTEEQVTIISMNGAIVKNEKQTGLKQYSGLQRGIYIIGIGDERVKVRN